MQTKHNVWLTSNPSTTPAKVFALRSVLYPHFWHVAVAWIKTSWSSHQVCASLGVMPVLAVGLRQFGHWRSSGIFANSTTARHRRGRGYELITSRQVGQATDTEHVPEPAHVTDAALSRHHLTASSMFISQLAILDLPLCASAQHRVLREILKVLVELVLDRHPHLLWELLDQALRDDLEPLGDERR